MHSNRKSNILFTAIIVLFMFVMGGVVILLENFMTSDDEVVMTGGNMTPSEIVENDNNSVRIWYYDDRFTSYLEKTSKKILKEKGIEVSFEKMDESRFLEKINDANISKTQGPDLFIMDSTQLEKACMAGIATENENSKLYNNDIFSDTAIHAVTYNNKMYGYPMNFDTAVLAYNTEVVTEVPVMFDDVIDFSNNMSDAVDGKLENVLMWDVNKLMYSYGFAGNYIQYGGEDGDNAKVKDFTNTEINKAMAYFKNLNQIFYIDTDHVSNDMVLEKFAQGKIAFTIFNTEGMNKIDSIEGASPYQIMVYPDMNKELKTKTMAVTNVLVANQFSKNPDVAKSVANYLSYEYAQEMYKDTGFMSSRKDIKYDDVRMDVLLAQYEKSTNLPKLMEAGDYAAKLEKILTIIWNGGDVEGNMKSLM